MLSTHPFSLRLYFSTNFSGGLQHSCCSRAALQPRRCRRSARRWRRRRRRWWREEQWLEIVVLLSFEKESFSTFSQKLATGYRQKISCFKSMKLWSLWYASSESVWSNRTPIENLVLCTNPKPQLHLFGHVWGTGVKIRKNAAFAVVNFCEPGQRMQLNDGW